MDFTIELRRPHARQMEFIESPAKRKVIRAGRRSGKTTGIAIFAAQMFMAGRRVLYATPTAEQIERFWFEVTTAFAQPIDAGFLYKNETRHVIEVPRQETRIRAKTAWDANTLRGDYADVLILDEFQLMNEDTWGVVGAPMLLDNDGDAVFIYTPPSLRTHSITKANDPMYAAKLFKAASEDKSGRWGAFHFTSHENPYISTDALRDIQLDMTPLAYQQEILAEDIEDAPGALWKRASIDEMRVLRLPDDIISTVVAMDPAATSERGADDCGIIGASSSFYDMTKKQVDRDRHLYITDDATVHGTPNEQASAAITLYHKINADALVVEDNNGGEWLETVIKALDRSVRVRRIHASRGKHTRAEPISALYQQRRGHHVGRFILLENELCQWIPGNASPNRLDALVWAASELIISSARRGGRGT